MTQSEPKWPWVILSEPEWTRVKSSEPKWAQVILSEPKCTYWVLPNWIRVISSEFEWTMIKYDEIWFNMIIWDEMWSNMMKYDKIWWHLKNNEIWEPDITMNQGDYMRADPSQCDNTVRQDLIIHQNCHKYWSNDAIFMFFEILKVLNLFNITYFMAGSTISNNFFGRGSTLKPWEDKGTLINEWINESVTTVFLE